jgi:hypothetical protein
MRFFLIGVVVIFLVSILIGQITTPKYTPFRKVLARGFYYTIIGTIAMGVLAGLAAIIYDFTTTRKGSETDFARMTKEQQEMVRDSLRNELPDPTMAEIKSRFIRFDFDAVLIPCYETANKLDVASLDEILELEVIGSGMSEGIYEVRTKGELKVNRPVTGFHIRGEFSIQYEFFEGDTDIDPGWKFDKIFIANCEVIAAEGEEKKPGPDELYPDLPRNSGS